MKTSEQGNLINNSVALDLGSAGRTLFLQDLEALFVGSAWELRHKEFFIL